ncbi:hypothetical protein AHiyo6_32540, partial [Arthrobacter sp. Hiyo6]
MVISAIVIVTPTSTPGLCRVSRSALRWVVGLQCGSPAPSYVGLPGQTLAARGVADLLVHLRGEHDVVAAG